MRSDAIDLDKNDTEPVDKYLLADTYAVLIVRSFGPSKNSSTQPDFECWAAW